MIDSLYSDTLPLIVGDSFVEKSCDINQTMPWIVALLIGILTVVISFFVHKSQRKLTLKNLEIQVKLSSQTIKKDILSNNRQKWINTLRDSVSEFLSSHELSKLINQHDKKSNGTLPEYREEFKKWQLLYYKIQLLLNPNEEKSQKLLELMIQLGVFTDYSSNSKEAEYEKIQKEIIKVTQLILKEEWERVKKLE
jgi:hypothetical protein